MNQLIHEYEQFYRYFTKQSSIDLFSLVLGLFLFLLPCVSSLLVAYSNLLTIPIGKWIICISCLIIIVLLYLIFRRHLAVLIASIISGSLIIALSVFLSSTYHVGNGSDDHAYHYPATYEIMNNAWNPVWDFQGVNAGFFSWKMKKFSGLQMVGMTAKAQWFAAAAMASITGKTISGNYTHFIFLLSCCLLLYNIFKYSYSFSTWVAFLLSFAFSSNPIALSQLFCGFVDGVAAITATIFLLFYITFFIKKDYWYLLISGFSIAFCIGTRTTFIMFAVICLFGIPLFTYFINKFNFFLFLKFVCLVVLIWSPIISNPYFYNLIKYGDPVYPQMANKTWLKNDQVSRVPPYKKSIDSDHSFDEYRKRFGTYGMNNALEFIYTQVISYGIDRRSTISMRSSDRFNYKYSAYHPSNGGFGPLYGVAFVLSIPLIIFLFWKKFWVEIVTIVVFSISVFFFPLPFYARYFGYAWLFPLLTALFVLHNVKLTKAVAGLALFISCILFINSVMITHAVTTKFLTRHDEWLKIDRFVNLYKKLGVVKYYGKSNLNEYLRYIEIAISEATGKDIEINLPPKQNQIIPKKSIVVWRHTLFPILSNRYNISDIEYCLMGIDPLEKQNEKIIKENFSITAPSSWVAAYSSSFLPINLKSNQNIESSNISLKSHNDSITVYVKIVIDSRYNDQVLSENLYSDFADGIGKNENFNDVHKSLSNGVNILVGTIPNSCEAFRIRLVGKNLPDSVKIKSISYGIIDKQLR